MSTRDPLAVAYDRRARHALNLAVQAYSIRQAAHVFVASPGPQFRRLDRGGRTVNERAFTRAAYYPVYSVPRALGELPLWSLKLTWGPIERRGSRYGRTVAVRLFRYAAGYAHAARGPQYTAGVGRSAEAHRIDG